jgi:hypothetical protein
VPGKRYNLQVRESLGDPFTDVAAAIFPRLAPGPLEVYWIDLSEGAPIASRYYRVQLVEDIQ